MVDRERRRIVAIWAGIWLLVAIGLGTSIASSIRSLRPEIIVETCSLLAALMLVIAERLAVHHASRRASLLRIAQEIASNARELCTGIWVMDRPSVAEELRDVEGGLRLYYPQLATAAVTAAILGPAFDTSRDFELISALQQWRAVAASCNTRLAMGQLLLFFSPPTREGLGERLRVHSSMAAVTIVEARKALLAIVEYLSMREGGTPASSEALIELEWAWSLLADAAADPTTDELRALAYESD